MTTKTQASPIRERTRDLAELVLFEDAAPDTGALATITATLATADEVNKNSRLYPLHVLTDAAIEANKAADRGELIGLLDHPDWNEGNKGTPSKTVIKWERVWMDGTRFMGEGKLLDTTLGRDLNSQRKAKIRLGLSINGWGSSRFVKATEVDPNTESSDLVQVIEKYQLLTADVVNDPASVSAAINREARALRERREIEMDAAERATQLETQLAAETAAREAAEQEAQTAKDALAQAQADLVTAEREGVVTTALAGRTVPEAVKTAMQTAARTADNLEAAQAAVKALADAYTTAGAGHGNNHVPETQVVKDALADARSEIGVTA